MSTFTLATELFALSSLSFSLAAVLPLLVPSVLIEVEPRSFWTNTTRTQTLYFTQSLSVSAWSGLECVN